MPRGGSRQGAGRPRAGHTLAAEKARQVITETVVERLAPLLEAAFDLAMGHNYEKTMPDGETTVVYTKSPNGEAIRDLFDRAFGKPVSIIQNPDGDQMLPFTIVVNQHPSADKQT